MIVARGYVVADHLPVCVGTVGYGGAVKSVPRQAIPMHPVSEHRQGDFGAVHDPIVKVDVGDGVEGGTDGSGDEEVLRVERFGGGVLGVGNEGAEIGGPQAV